MWQWNKVAAEAKEKGAGAAARPPQGSSAASDVGVVLKRAAAADRLNDSLGALKKRIFAPPAVSPRGGQRPLLRRAQDFVRDFVPSALAFLMNNGTEIVKNFLLKTLHLQSSEKMIDRFKSGSGAMLASFRVDRALNRNTEIIVATLARVQAGGLHQWTLDFGGFFSVPIQNILGIQLSQSHQTARSA